MKTGLLRGNDNRGYGDSRLVAVMAILAIGAVLTLVGLMGGGAAMLNTKACSYNDVVFGKEAELSTPTDIYSKVLPGKTRSILSELKSAKWKQAGHEFGIDRPPSDSVKNTVELSSATGEDVVNLTVYSAEVEGESRLWLKVSATKLDGKPSHKTGYYIAI